MQSASPNHYRQPRALYFLFSTELWERFGFYALQTIIILYMTQGLKFTDVKANNLFAAFSSLLYLTPAIGGYLADRYLGFQRAIIIGGILLMLGYCLMIFSNENMFFWGLSVLIVANGFFKPNVSSIVGELYEPGDPRRDGAFTLFYMGINIGALIPPLFIGYLVKSYGWHVGFIFPAIGMLIGLIVFLAGRAMLKGAGSIPKISPLTRGGKSAFLFNLALYPGIVIAIILCYYAFDFPNIASLLVIIAAILLGLVTLGFILKETKDQRNKMLAALILVAISVVFWALYNQVFTSLTLYADRNMQQVWLGIPVNAEAMQFFNPFFIIALSPLLSRLWIWLDIKKLNPSYPTKFAFGVLFMSLGFLLLAYCSRFAVTNGLNSSWWLVFSYLLQTIGELLLSPIGLSMITVLSPKYLVGMMMGVWFFSQAASFAIGGHLANLAAIPAGTSVVQSMAIYNSAFTLLGVVSFVFALFCFFTIPFLKRMIGELA